MKQIISGAGADVTSTVAAWLKANKTIWLANLYLIGEADDPRAVWLTDWESPLCWPVMGTFLSTVIKRGNVSSKIGLEAESLDLTWSPANRANTSSLNTASPYQLARLGAFDNKRVRIWRCYMPTPGDANTFGAMELFGGFIGDCASQRGSIHFSVNSYLYVLNQKVPTGLIEVTNTLASYTGGTPPPGYSVLPQFSVFTGSTPTLLYLDETTPNPGNIPAGGVFDGGYVVFNAGPDATLAGQFSIVGNSGAFTDGDGNHHVALALMNPLPWSPTPGVDTCYVSAATPAGQADGDYYGFTHVPAPETAV